MHRFDLINHLLKPGVLAVAVALAACDAPPEDAVVVAEVDPAVETVAPVAPPMADTPTLGEAAPYGEPQAGTTLMVSSMGVAKPYLVDSSGSALYTIESADGPAACTDACLEAWPPVLVENAPIEGAPATVGSQLQAGLLGTVERDDGTTQVSYGGHLLYRYAVDVPGGPPVGHDVTDQWGEWYLVGPEGELLPEGVVEAAADAGEEEASGY